MFLYRAQVVPPPVPEVVETETSVGVNSAPMDGTDVGSRTMGYSGVEGETPSCPSEPSPQHMSWLSPPSPSLIAQPCVCPRSIEVSPSTPDPRDVPAGWCSELPITTGSSWPARVKTRSSWSSSK